MHEIISIMKYSIQYILSLHTFFQQLWMRSLSRSHQKKKPDISVTKNKPATKHANVLG